MKTEYKEEPITELKVIGTKKVPVYVTDDGKEFKNEQQAIEHETKAKSEEEFIKKYNVTYLDDYILFYIIDLKEIGIGREFQKWICNNICARYLSNGWNLIEIDSSGDYSIVDYYTPDSKIDSIKCHIRSLEQEIKTIQDFKDKNDR